MWMEMQRYAYQCCCNGNLFYVILIVIAIGNLDFNVVGNRNWFSSNYNYKHDGSN